MTMSYLTIVLGISLFLYHSIRFLYGISQKSRYEELIKSTEASQDGVNNAMAAYWSVMTTDFLISIYVILSIMLITAT